MKKFLGVGAVLGVLLAALLFVSCEEDPTGGTIVVKNTTENMGIAGALNYDDYIEAQKDPSGELYEESLAAGTAAAKGETYNGKYVRVIKGGEETTWNFDDDGDYAVSATAVSPTAVPVVKKVSLSGGSTETIEIK